MGIGFRYTCKCGTSTPLCLGEGLSTPRTCAEIWEAMAGGKYEPRF